LDTKNWTVACCIFAWKEVDEKIFFIYQTYRNETGL
jgi:hypothetical protein